MAREEDEDRSDEGGESSWGWLWIVLIIGGFWYVRKITNEAWQSSAPEGQTQYQAQPVYYDPTPQNYTFGSLDHYWVEETRTRGANSGLLYMPPVQQVEQNGQQELMLKMMEQQQAEMERMRIEIKRLRNTKRESEY